MEAARAAGARRVLAQSFSGWPNIREGGPVKTEEDPLDPHPPAKIWKIYQAIRYLEDTVTGATGVEGLVLRYGFFYGPGTSFEEGGQFVAMVRKRLFPIVGNGARVWSFSTSRTRPRPRWRPWSGANRGSTTWWTTNPRRCRCGCRTSPRSWGPSPLCACRCGLGAWSVGTSEWS
jgi:hypothetical protein